MALSAGAQGKVTKVTRVTILRLRFLFLFGWLRFVSPCYGYSVYLPSTAGQPPRCASFADQPQDALMAAVAVAKVVGIFDEIGRLVVVVGAGPDCLDDCWHRRSHTVGPDSRS